MLRTQAGAAANENLDATAARAGEGLGSWVPGPTPAGFSLAPLNPSQQVHNTWAEGPLDGKRREARGAHLNLGVL